MTEPTAAAPATKAYSAKTSAMHFWGLGGIGEYYMYATFSLVGTAFVLGFKLDPILVGIAACIPRILDGVIDPFLGHLSDNTHTRWGRRRPFLLFSALLGVVAALIFWRVDPNWGQHIADLQKDVPDWLAGWWASRDWSQTILFLWMTLLSLFAFTVFGLYSMNNQALGYELSDDYNDRARVQAIRGFWWALAGFGGSYIWWVATLDFSTPFVLPDCAAAVLGFLHLQPAAVTAFVQQVIDHLPFNAKIYFHGDMIEGLRFLSFPIAALILIFGLIPVFTLRERFKTANRTHVNLWPALKATLRIRPFAMFLLLRVTQALSLGLFGVVGGYIFLSYVCFGDLHLSFVTGPIFAPLPLVLAFAMMFLAKRICARLGKYASLVICAGLGLVGAICAPFTYVPGHWEITLYFGIPMTIIATFLGAPQAAIMPDICDIDELKSGERREALFTAVMVMVAKFENSLIALSSGFILHVIGFDQHLTQQPPDVNDRLRWFGFTALIIFSALGFLISWFIPITEKKMALVRAQLEERRRVQVAAGNPEV